MNKRIEELALESELAYRRPDGRCWIDAGFVDLDFERFAELVRQDAMEEAATICDGLNYNGIDPLGCAAAIRNRAEEELL